MSLNIPASQKSLLDILGQPAKDDAPIQQETLGDCPNSQQPVKWILWEAACSAFLLSQAMFILLRSLMTGD